MKTPADLIPLLQACLANPDDIGRRLIVSDWLMDYAGWSEEAAAFLRGAGEWTIGRFYPPHGYVIEYPPPLVSVKDNAMLKQAMEQHQRGVGLFQPNRMPVQGQPLPNNNQGALHFVGPPEKETLQWSFPLSPFIKKILDPVGGFFHSNYKISHDGVFVFEDFGPAPPCACGQARFALHWESQNQRWACSGRCVEANASINPCREIEMNDPGLPAEVHSALVTAMNLALPLNTNWVREQLGLISDITTMTGEITTGTFLDTEVNYAADVNNQVLAPDPFSELTDE